MAKQSFFDGGPPGSGQPDGWESRFDEPAEADFLAALFPEPCKYEVHA
jgi:hypothetical protein